MISQINMQNNYIFTNIESKVEIIGDRKNYLFSQMKKLILDGNLKPILVPFDQLEYLFLYEKYYLGHDITSYKGKKMIFRGKLIEVQREDLISFINSSIADDDLRAYLLAPVFNDIPREIFLITEDYCCLYRDILPAHLN